MTPDILPYAILTGTSVALGVASAWWGEVRVRRMRATKQYWEGKATTLRWRLAGLRSYVGHIRGARETAEACMKGMAAALYDAEDRLREIERQRSETTRKGNATKAAKRKALVDARKAELDSWNADRIAA